MKNNSFNNLFSERLATLEAQQKAQEKLSDERERHFSETLKATSVFLDERFAAEQQAIKKAEEAQNAYNINHNDLVRKNEDMQKKTDAKKDYDFLIDKLDSLRNNLLSKIDSLQTAVDLKSGQTKGTDKTLYYVITLIGIIIALTGALITTVIYIFK